MTNVPIAVMLKNIVDAVTAMYLDTAPFQPRMEWIRENAEWAAYSVWTFALMLLGIWVTFYILKMLGSIIYYVSIVFVICGINVGVTWMMVSYCVRPPESGGHVCFIALNRTFGGLS